MKITVLGAGAIGAAVAQDLAGHPDVTAVQVCDLRARHLQELPSHPKLRSFQVDARDTAVLRSILAGSQAVVGAVPGEMNVALAALCVDLGVHFLDLGGSDRVVERQLALSDEARARGVWVVPNCGLAPGLVNVLCLEGMAAFDAVEAAHVRVGDLPLAPVDPFDFVVNWTAEKLLEDYLDPVEVLRDGALAHGTPLADLETLCFPAPYGAVEAFTTQGGLGPLARSIAGRVQTLDHKTIRWPGHAEKMRFLLALGLADRQTIDVRTHLTYRDVLVRRLRQRVPAEQADALLLRVLVRGTKDGRPQTLVYELLEEYDAATGTTAMKRCTAIPTAVLAVMVASGEVPGGGAAPPEQVAPRGRYLEAVRARGLDVRAHLYDGHLAVTAPSLADDGPCAKHRAEGGASTGAPSDVAPSKEAGA